MFSDAKKWIIGKPLKSNELGEQKLNKRKALAILSSDALSSVAYGPEQVFIVLAAAGAAAYWYSLPIGMGVLLLLTVLILSYRQILYAYPQGGGAYVVAKEQLGVYPGLIAGGSLLVDYILTVAVSVSAGTDAITSAIPVLHEYNVPIAILFVLAITLLNLRGLTESASVMAYPAYLFVLALLILIIGGIWRIATGQEPAGAHGMFGVPVAGVGLFLLVKAFASGSSALTGVEAISNAIPNFKAPAAKNAVRTLVAMGILLAALFAGILFLAYYYGISPRPEVTLVSDIAERTFGRNFVYYLIQGVTALILILAANTGYSAFPMLAVNLAKDKFVPRMFSARGDRLGYSNGIIVLGLLSIVLIIAFQGRTERLIPLYAVGVFIPFALSQTGMTMKWLREKPKGWALKLGINAIGALVSLMVVLIFFITKPTQVWPVLIFLPVLIVVFLLIRSHYRAVGDGLRISEEHEPPVEGNVLIVPVAGITKVVEGSLNYARSLAADHLIAVHVSFEREEEEAFQAKWAQWQPDVRLVTLHSPYRSIIQPLSKFIDVMQRKAGAANYRVTVIIPQFVPKKGWHNMLHNQSGFLLHTYLLYRRDIIVTTVPYHLPK